MMRLAAAALLLGAAWSGRADAGELPRVELFPRLAGEWSVERTTWESAASIPKKSVMSVRIRAVGPRLLVQEWHDGAGFDGPMAYFMVIRPVGPARKLESVTYVPWGGGALGAECELDAAGFTCTGEMPTRNAKRRTRSTTALEGAGRMLIRRYEAGNGPDVLVSEMRLVRR